MATKQTPNSRMAPDGSQYVTLTDGAGSLAPATGGGGGGNPNGQATMANSAPVVLASDQSAIPVSQSGTWTVQPGNTANTTAWKVDGSAVTQPVSAASLPLPTGAATAAGLTTINTTLGTPFQASGSIGNTSFAATQATAASLNATVVGTGTFATQLTGATNNINNIAGTVSLPTGAATSANQTTMGTNQTVVQAPVAPATATATKANLIAGQYNSAVQAFTNGQQGSLQLDQRGGLLIQDGQAIPSVSVTSAATLFTVADTSGYGSISLQVTSAGVGSTITYENSEDGVTWLPVIGYGGGTSIGGTTSVTTTALSVWFPIVSKQFRARVSTYGSGTVTIQGTLRSGTLPRQSMLVAISGTTAISGSVSGSTVEAAAVGSTSIPTSYEGRTTNKTAVTTGQYVRPIATSIGAAVNKPFQVPELDWSYPAAAGGISNTTTAVTMVAAAGSGIRNYLTAIQISAGTLGAATEVAVRDGAAGTVIWRGFLSTAGGNQSVNLSSPIKSTANTLLEVVTLTATVTGSVYINAQGYQAP